MYSPAYTLLTAISLASVMQCTLAQATITGDGMDGADNLKCPGVLSMTGNNQGYCCVGGELDLSTCAGWPICTGSTREPRPVTCATKIPITAKDYSKQVQSASSKYLQGSEASATDSMASATSAGGNDKPTTTKTNSAASASETDNSSNAKMPDSMGGVIGGILAM
ncbi:hypothetical protein FHETE_8436 [Fusarium heterosporum]|uniref:Uncharacterized protein n=1 Tax=Fusarium heterosporum TaxID=42747 RepID=A0A8H5SWR2_FUSHE|nr:hypothetical protein FHETE_8436 [Fusarium heterosporum]